MKNNTSKYQENWDNVFSDEAKHRQKQIEKELLEKEQKFREELEKKQALEQKQQQKVFIKTKIKKLL